MIYEANKLRKGLRIDLGGIPHIILDTQFVKPGKGQAFTRLKIKNLLNGTNLDKTCKIGEKLLAADVIEKDMQFLYIDQNDYLFMDTETYVQINITKEQIGENWKWLTAGSSAKIMIHNEQAVGIELPNFVILKIVSCEAGLKGDRVSKAMKEVKIETTASIQAPIFINEGDKIKIDTRTGEYVERIQ